MKLNDILPTDKWIALEKDLHNRYGLDVNVFDTSGVRISDFKEWVNRLCPAIKATDKGQSFICAVAHMNIAAQAMQTRRPAIEECDAGLVKIVVPIFMDDAFLGAVGACGLLLDEGEVDTFLIDKITGIDEETAQELAAGVGTISSAGAELLAEDVTRQIISIVTAYKNKQQS
ncbi:MAG: PocR ligand-binding domain-containing protein [Desulfobacterales bacterium]|jgi:ligand-binding sensor protein